MRQIRVSHYATPCGTLVLGDCDGRLCMCDWLTEPHHARVVARLQRSLGAVAVEAASDVVDMARRQLDEYFDGRRRTFDVPLLMVGTPFQQSAWRELLRLPYGTTITYADEARRLGRPSAVRAVAQANGANALSVVIPCHRVVASDGSVGGYGGGVAAKRFLLELETTASRRRHTPTNMNLE